MVANKNDRKQRRHGHGPTKTFDTGPMPEGYGYADRVIVPGEEVYVWETRLMHGRGEPKWVKVIARPAQEYWAGHNAPPTDLGFSFIDPETDRMSYHTALRYKKKWVKDATYPHGGKHVAIGLHDPNPFVCIKTDGDKPMEVDEKGLAYYSIAAIDGIELFNRGRGSDE